MTPERWKRIEELYHAADALPTAERTHFLATTCGGDDTARREVEALLNEPSAEVDLLAQPAIIRGAHLVADLATTAILERTVGGYRMTQLLGAGGMGEVYRARDPKLGRDVAIKVLPPAFSSDPERLARFEREARILGALNHPGICAIHGVEDVGGIRLLVLELVEGPTLAEKLEARRDAGEPGLPLHEALTIARLLADALEAAHDRGIIHRDLKPANIKVTAAGLVKILDFGLAKSVNTDSGMPDPHASADRQRVWTPRRHDGHRGVREPGTGARSLGRQANGHLGVRLRALRDAHRAHRVRGRHGVRLDREDPRARAGLDRAAGRLSSVHPAAA